MARAKKTVLGRLITWVVRVVLVLVVLLVGLLAFAGRFVTPDFVVSDVEDSINCRLEIEAVNVQVLRFPSRIVLKGIKLGPRDEFVGRPLAERSAMDSSAIELGEVRLEVGLLGLLSRKLEVKELSFLEPSVSLTILERGGSNIEDLFRPSPEKEKRRKKRGKRRGGALNLEEVGLLGRLEGVRIQDGSMDVHLEETGMVIELRELAVYLDSIEVDPFDLARSNDARMTTRGEITLAWKEEGQAPSGFLEVDGEATVKLFDPETADFDPEVTGLLALGEGSYLSARVPPISKTWAKIGRVANWGIRWGGLPERATFGRGATVGLHYFHERLTAVEPISLELGDWELAALKDSWLDLADEEHEISGEFVASKGVSALLRSGMMTGVGFVHDSVEDEVAAEVGKAWFQDERLIARVQSSGKLSDPEVDVLNKFPKLREILKEALKDEAKEKLKDLGGSLLDRLKGGDEEE